MCTRIVLVTSSTVGQRVTISGARIAPCPADLAGSFLARFDQRPPQRPIVVLGAFEEDQTLIGVAAVGDQDDANAFFVIVVDPARRELKIGSDLLHAAIEATEAIAAVEAPGIRRLRTIYRQSAAADRLLDSSGLLVARRRAGGEVTAVVFLPPS